jgi:hypothetical protein
VPQGKATYLQGSSMIFEVRFGSTVWFFSLGALRHFRWCFLLFCASSLTARRAVQVPEIHAAIAKCAYPSF